MIKFLANFFRGLSLFFGITAPPPEENRRRFVFMWFGIIAIILAFSGIIFYALSRMHL